MMPEISLNILDVAQNSVTAEASLITLKIKADSSEDRLTVSISDNGRGMTSEQLQRVTDPFFTTRTTRKVGLGIPFFKMAAEITGGEFSIKSIPGEGTCTTAIFGLSSIDRMPMGDLSATMTTLIGMNADIDFVLDYSVNNDGFVMDTREFRQILGDVSLGEQEVLQYIADYINDGISSCGII